MKIREILILMLLVAIHLANTKLCKNLKELLKPWHMGTHLRVLNKSCPMSTNMTLFRWFFKVLFFLVLWTKVALALEELREFFDKLALEHKSSISQNITVAKIFS